VPGGWAAQRWGGRRTLMASFALWSTACLLTPGTAANVPATMVARVAVGVAQGLLIPSIHTVLSQARGPPKQAPPQRPHPTLCGLFARLSKAPVPHSCGAVPAIRWKKWACMQAHLPPLPFTMRCP